MSKENVDVLLSSLFDTKILTMRLAHKHLRVHDQNLRYFKNRRSQLPLIYPLLILYAKSIENIICTGFVLTMWFLNSKKYKTVFTLYFLFETQTPDHGIRSLSDIHFSVGISLLLLLLSNYNDKKLLWRPFLINEISSVFFLRKSMWVQGCMQYMFFTNNLFLISCQGVAGMWT